MCIRDRLELNGVQVGAGDLISFSDIDNGNLTFQPDLNTNGLGLASLTFSVVDDGGTANGGLDQDQTPNSLVFDVTPVNDAPVAVDDNSLVTDEDVALTGSVLGNDSDIDGDTLTVDQMPVTGPSNGTLCLLYTSPSPRDATLSRMPSSA